MKALVLAAGHGERMRPLTDHTPKPLLQAGGRALIEYHLLALATAGIIEVMINHGRLGEQIASYLGDGSNYGLRLNYSPEGEHPLETGGGIMRALPWLGTNQFLVLNADIWTDYPYGHLQSMPTAQDLAHLILVNNPEHHPHGDFNLTAGRVTTTGNECLTFAGIGIYRPELFANCTPGKFPLAPVLRSAMAAGRVSGEYWPGNWIDVGTPTRLATLQTMLARNGHTDS